MPLLGSGRGRSDNAYGRPWHNVLTAIEVPSLD